MRRRWLGTLLLAPLLLGGCGSSAETPTAAPSPVGDSWVVVDNGKAVPSAAVKGYTAKPNTFPTGFLPLSTATPTATPTPTGSCIPPGGATKLNSAAVVPGATSAAVTFYNRGGVNLVEYRVTAMTQDLQTGAQREIGWTVITPGATCGFMTATVNGLDRKTHYQFSVIAVTSPHDRDGTNGYTVARSAVVQTT